MLQKLTPARRHARETSQKARNMRGKMLGAAASYKRRDTVATFGNGAAVANGTPFMPDLR